MLLILLVNCVGFFLVGVSMLLILLVICVGLFWVGVYVAHLVN
jgi:hypothetical protein